MKKVIIILSILILPAFFIYYVIASADVHDDVIKEMRISNKNAFDLSSHLIKYETHPDSLFTKFPYSEYVTAANIWNIKSIIKDLDDLDSFSRNNYSLNRQTLSEALTTKLSTRFSNYYDQYQPDSLLRLLQWAEKFQAYSEIDAHNDIFYQSIYNYWMDILSNRLSVFSNEQPSRLYDFKFSYLRARLIERRFAPSVTITSKDKFFLNLITGNWGHLINATWNQASKGLLCMLALVGFVLLSGIYFIVVTVYRFLIKNKKMRKNSALLSIALLLSFYGQAQSNYVETMVSTINNEKFGLIKMQRKDNRIKVKYFAAKDTDGTPVYQRYRNWANNKKIVAVSSGTYMDKCDPDYSTNPIGLCIDQGRIVNLNLVNDGLDALVIVYATGGMVASNLKEGNLSITYPDGTKKILNIRGSSYDKSEFIKWAQETEATVFQTHLFVYQDQVKIKSGAVKPQERRFLAVCKADNDAIVHYMINLPTYATLHAGAMNAFNILKNIEDVKQVVFMINLDTGCQNVFSIFNDDGNEYQDKLLKGTTELEKSINLVAYYYE